MDKKINNHQSLLFVIQVLMLGVTALIIQLVFIRSLLSMFQGNELIIGIIFSNWLLMNGMGALTAKWLQIKTLSVIKLNWLQSLQITISILFLFLAYLLRFNVFKPGTDVGMLETFFFSALILLPVSGISGMLFTLSCRFFSGISEHAISKTYSIESTGSIIGSLLFTFLVVHLFLPFQTLLFLLILNIIFAFFYEKQASVKKYIPKIALIFSSILLLLFINPDKIALAYLFPGQTITAVEESRFGILVSTESSNQYHLYSNGTLISTNSQVISTEECVHFALAIHPNPKKILVIGGGNQSFFTEIKKYHPDEIDYIELDIKIIESLEEAEKHQFKTIGVNIIIGDAFRYLAQSSTYYDIIICNMPDPKNAQYNRYYTQEFFSIVSNNLYKNGIFTFSLSDQGIFLGQQALNYYSSIYNSLQSAFTNSMILSSANNFFLASNTTIARNHLISMKQKGIHADYFNAYYLDTSAVYHRGSLITQKLQKNASINHVMHPIVYRLFQSRWQEHQQEHQYLFYGLILIPFFIIFFIRNRHKWLLAISGFTASSAQMVLILLFQVYFGFVYHMIGVIFLVYMLGLAIGSGLIPGKFLLRIFRVHSIQLLFAILLSLLWFIVKFDFIAQDFSGIVIILMLNFIIALFAGIQFHLSSKFNYNRKNLLAGNIYGSDLLGSAMGSIVIVSLLIPWLGFPKTIIALSILNYSGFFLYSKLIH